MPQGPQDVEVTIPVAAEAVVVDKRKTVTGTVHLRTVVHEDDVVVDEPLLAEEISVERVPVDRWVDGPVPVRQEGDITIIPILEEVVVVEKRLKVTQEVRVTKRQTSRRTPQRVTVRREEAIVDRHAPSPTDQAGAGTEPAAGAEK